MALEIDEFHASLVNAVQAELERHAAVISAEIDRLRTEGEFERQLLRTEFAEQIAALSTLVDHDRGAADDLAHLRHELEQRFADVDGRAAGHADRVREELGHVLEQRLADVDGRAAGHADRVREELQQRFAEAEVRSTRRIDDVAAGVEGLAKAAVRPLLSDMTDQQAELNRRVENLDGKLHKFDEQAGRMVAHFNEVSEQLEQRQVALGDAITADVATRIGELKGLVDDQESTMRRFQSESNQAIAQRVSDAEDRLNNRLLAAESRMKEDAGQRIAEIDAHVGKVASGLDETMLVLNERIAALDDRFVETGRRIADVEASVEGIDADALDALKEKLSTAVGEAMLVRIEMERLEKGVNERTDGLAVRMTEVESQLQDATMDTSMAIQLDRLEEIERSLLALDPAKFVLRDEDEMVKKSTGGADGHDGGDAVASTDPSIQTDGSWA